MQSAATGEEATVRDFGPEYSVITRPRAGIRPRPLTNDEDPMARIRRHRRDTVQSPLETYLREINEVALLTADEEKELAQRIAAGDKTPAIAWFAPTCGWSSTSPGATSARGWRCRI